jgi:hypothetical protein
VYDGKFFRMAPLLAGREDRFVLTFANEVHQ